jgi:hypothetical protein
MQITEKLDRHPAPASRPHPLAYLNGLLWVGSWDTHRIYAIDPQSWSVRQEIEAPGRPYGLTVVGSEMRAVIAHGEEEDRFLYRLTPDGGFDLSSKAACPDFTGSHLAASGTTLYLGQMGFHRILVLQPDMTIEREIALPTRCAGFGFGPDGRFYMISADEEFEDLKFGTLDVSQSAPPFEAIGAMPEEARSLVYDGSRWWTSLRDANEIASFSP